MQYKRGESIPICFLPLYRAGDLCMQHPSALTSTSQLRCPGPCFPTLLRQSASFLALLCHPSFLWEECAKGAKLWFG